MLAPNGVHVSGHVIMASWSNDASQQTYFMVSGYPFNPMLGKVEYTLYPWVELI